MRPIVTRGSMSLLACMATTVTLQAGDDFAARYMKSEPALYERFVHNRKVTTRSKSYKLAGTEAKLFTSGETTTVTSEDSSRQNYWNDEGGDPSKRMISGGLLLPDDGYGLVQAGGPGQYRIGHQRKAPPDPLDRGPGFNSGSGPMIPLMYYDSLLSAKFGKVLRALNDPTGPYRLRTIESVRDVTWNGRRAVAVRMKIPFNIRNTVYLDPDNHLAFLGFESDGSFDEKAKGKGPVRQTGLVTYAPSKEGYPLPTKFEVWYVLPSGRKLPHVVTEFVEYSRYTPTADDFDLEKQFGVKPLPKPAAGSPATTAIAANSRPGWWLYALAGVFGTVTAGPLAYRRLRKGVRA